MGPEERRVREVSGPGELVASDPILRVTDLTKRFGELLAVDQLALEVRRGEVLGFLGPNGAGKTTTLRMLCGLLRPDGGIIELGGRPLVPGEMRGLSAVGVSPQSLVIWETLTCQEQLELMGRMYGLRFREARSRATRLLQTFGLEEKARRLGRTLSGGMKRRLNIALGLVHEPEILFLDEPQAGLDPQSRVLVRDYVKSLRGKMTVVITTHDMEEAEKLADRVCIIDHGKKLVLDSVAGVKHQFGNGELTEITLDGEAAPVLVPFLDSVRPSLTYTVAGDTLSLSAKSAAQSLLVVLQEIERRGRRVVRLHTRSTTLEDVFIALTGRSLRE